MYNDNIRHILNLETRDNIISICVEREQIKISKPKIIFNHDLMKFNIPTTILLNKFNTYDSVNTTVEFVGFKPQTCL